MFTEIAILLAIATIVGTISLKLRQPLIIAFIAVGIMFGPSGLDYIDTGEELELLAELGIALLLFIVGLKLDPNEIKEVGPVAITAGGGQVIATALVGYGLASLFGLGLVPSLYVAIALTFSSTIIIVKLLSDKRELESLHSRIAIGILVVQDIAVIAVMIILSAFGENDSGNLAAKLGTMATHGGGFLVVVGLMTKYVLPKLLHSLAQSQELLMIFAITWAIALASLADYLGFSKEVGAFLAGISIATTPYRIPIGARLVSIRDFLLLFFFINLGIHIDLNDLGSQIFPAIILSTFVILGKPFMVNILVSLAGYRKYTSITTSLALGQISEFSLILASLGVALGHINTSVQGLITLVGLITMGLSTYMIIYSHKIYPYLKHSFGRFEKPLGHKKYEMDADDAIADTSVDVILFGLGRYGGSMIKYLQREGMTVLGVDFDPHLVNKWRSQGLTTYYGDMEDPEFAAVLPLSTAKWVVSTIPGDSLSLSLLHSLKNHGFKGRIALTSHTAKELNLFELEGADLVLLPFRDAASEAARMLAHGPHYVDGL